MRIIRENQANFPICSGYRFVLFSLAIQGTDWDSEELARFWNRENPLRLSQYYVSLVVVSSILAGILDERFLRLIA
jgi:hypothetical protein